MSIATEKKAIDRPRPIVLHVPIDEEIILADDVKIPAGIVDLASFREWARSDEFPERGRIDYSNGTLVVDLSMEQAYDHNQLKTAILTALYSLAATLRIGRMFSDGMSLSMPMVERSTKPDALFVSFASFKSNRVVKCPGRVHGITEFEGAPDMTLEVVSDSSVDKDLSELPEQYYRAGVQEFWRVDARDGTCVFEIFRSGSDGFIPAEKRDGWQRSTLFGRWFQIRQTADDIGDPFFELLAKE